MFGQHLSTQVNFCSLCQDVDHSHQQCEMHAWGALNDMKKEAQQFKSIHTLKATSVHLINMNSWDTAVKKLPLDATKEQLSRFIQCDLCKKSPKSFSRILHEIKGV